ncbi:MAG: IS66 family transposase [Planctomycetota bacterium]|jgi:transposase
MAKFKTPTVDLPEDISTLQAMVLQLLSDVNEKNRQIDDLQNQLEWFKRHVFGRRSEKLSLDQLTLFQGMTAEQTATPEESSQDPTDVPQRSKKHLNGRRPLPEDLPRERIEYHPPQEDLICSCCGQAKQAIGEEVTEELDYVPASFVVRQHVRIKYACRNCQEGVVIADLPARPIEKGRPGTGLLAHVLTSKYCDHLPLHRQEGIWKRHGVHIMRSTMCDWVRDCADLLSPIVRYMQTVILQSKKIHTDDTPVPIQDGSRRQTRKGYLWAYIGDKNDVVFDYTRTHSRDGPVAFLGDYSGYVHADAYKGYDAFFEKGNATEVACWAHTRRKFFDSLTTDPRRAHEMLAMIGKLYDVEQQAKEDGLDAIAIKDLRQKQSKPILEDISDCLDDWSIEVLPKSPIGQAVSYARGQWMALNQYTENGDLDIDNNLAERILRIVAIGRKNWLFAGSDAGGERAAIVYSLVASCKLCEIDPFQYLRDVLDRVSTHPAKKVAQLTPAGWKRPPIAGN